ncbi:MAG: GNAT family N-acetyltransferase [Thermoplasmata archaeon]|nr:GNAT family N-acetyltransferase [Thermoplasmata archaeon]
MCSPRAGIKDYHQIRQQKQSEKSNEKPNSATLSIETLDGTLIGNISYHEGLPRHDATFGIVTGKEYWGKGYALEAQELLMQFLFHERGIQIMRLWTQGGFPWAKRAAEKLGFKEMARLRQNTIIDGKIVDCIYMDMTRQEYYAARELEDNVGAP